MIPRIRTPTPSLIETVDHAHTQSPSHQVNEPVQQSLECGESSSNLEHHPANNSDGAFPFESDSDSLEEPNVIFDNIANESTEAESEIDGGNGEDGDIEFENSEDDEPLEWVRIEKSAILFGYKLWKIVTSCDKYC